MAFATETGKVVHPGRAPRVWSRSRGRCSSEHQETKGREKARLLQVPQLESGANERLFVHYW